MLITAVTMVVSSGAVVIWRINDWSILRASIGNFPQIAQAGVPRAEVIDGQLHPLALSVLRMDAVDSACFIRTLSVSSSSRDLGSKPVPRGLRIHLQENSRCRNSIAEMFTAIVASGRPASSQARACSARFTKDPVADRQNQAAVFRNGNEIVPERPARAWDASSVSMLPRR